jgi:hypothetical protein
MMTRRMKALLTSSFAVLWACSTASWPPHAAAAVESASALAVAAPFLPAGYEGELFTDFAAMRRNGLLDRIERLPMMGSFLDAQAASYGCDLDDLQRVRTALVFDAADTGRSLRMVSVAEVDPIAEPVAMPEPWQPWEQDGVRGHRADGGAFPALVVRPAPGIVVAGEHDLVVPLLAGPAGAPHPELLPFLAGERLLFQYAAGTFGRPAHTRTGTIGFFGRDDPDDPCELLRARLGEDAGGGLVLSATLRYRPRSANLRRSEVELRAFLDRIVADEQFAALKPLLTAVIITHDARDLHVQLPLGPPRDAIRTLERAVLGLAAIQSARSRR